MERTGASELLTPIPKERVAGGNFLGVVCSPAIKSLWSLHPKELRGSQTDYEPLSFTPFRDEGSGDFDPDKTPFLQGWF